MATLYSTALAPTNASNHIAVWAQYIEDLLVTTGGWVVTSDTGQTLPASLTTPGAANTKAGYRIYRMNDALQSTNPVFMRLDFGSSTGSANSPCIWMNIGTGSNGSGTITGAVFNKSAVSNPLAISIAASATPGVSFGSATTSRFCFALFTNTTSAGLYMIFGVERSKNSSGADTGDGLIIIRGGGLVEGASYNALASCAYVVLAGGTQATEEIGISCVLSRQSPSETFPPGDVGVGVVMPFRGVAQQPGTQFMITNNNDITSFGSFSMTLYGSTRTYQHLGSLLPVYRAYAGNASSDGSARVVIQYD